MVHKNLLIQDSPTAKAMLSSGFRESIAQQISWPEFETAHFKIYLEFLYSGRFNSHKATLTTLLKLHSIADQLGSELFLAAVFKEIYELTYSNFYDLEPADLDYGMENTVESSVLHRYLVDKVVTGILRGRYRFAEDDPSRTDPSAKVIDSSYRTEILDGFMRVHTSGITMLMTAMPSLDDYQKPKPVANSEIISSEKDKGNSNTDKVCMFLSDVTNDRFRDTFLSDLLTRP